MTLVEDSRARIDLSGPWQIAFDPDGQGVSAGWAAGTWPADQARILPVPSIWERYYPDSEGHGFYRRVFTMPSDWSQRVVYLRFSGASYRSDVWLNGVYLGSHEGAYTPFRFDATAAARPGAENELVVRVTGLAKNRAIDGLPLLQTPISKQSWYYTYSGLWSDVVVEAAPVLSCHEVVIQPHLRQEAVQVGVALRNASQDARPIDLTLTVHAPTGDTACNLQTRVTLAPGVLDLCPSSRAPAATAVEL